VNKYKETGEKYKGEKELSFLSTRVTSSVATCFFLPYHSAMSIYELINALTGYGVTTGLVDSDDVIFTKNRLLELFALDGFESLQQAADLPKTSVFDLPAILSGMLEYASSHGLCDGESIVSRDHFDTKIMGMIMPLPSTVIQKFRGLYKESPQKATDFFYAFSQDTNYIRRDRIARDLKWKTKTEYGDLDITINLSKPEKDPKAIAAAKNAPQTGYPPCVLCKENVGYAGTASREARQSHRTIPLVLNGEKWSLQYSPYVYYNEHCIVFSDVHRPMKICREAFCRLFDFVTQFPHYTIGSNADLPIVGGSVLSHDHFQGGRYEFPMTRANVEEYVEIKGFTESAQKQTAVNDVPGSCSSKCTDGTKKMTAGIVNWPMSVIRLRGSDAQELISCADKILCSWRAYTDKDSFIFAETNGETHNTITPVARRRGSDYELDLVLRNNSTTAENPLGVFHPHAELQHIKKENIGLIEVMGLAVLPSRLKKELADLEKAILEKRDISSDSELAKHAPWASQIVSAHPDLCASNIQQILEYETGVVFSHVLEHAGVFKRTAEGKAAFKKFIAQV
jgi:UDPglucose--hexose-1-phosphate uridylyltransferase